MKVKFGIIGVNVGYIKLIGVSLRIIGVSLGFIGV